MRGLLEKLGVIEPRPPEIDEVRSTAMEINEQARREIHESRERRNILNLEYELAQRRRNR